MTAEVVTSENAAEFYAKRLPQRDPPADEQPQAESKADPQGEEQQSKGETEGKDKPRKPIQPRINELVAERNAARDEAQAVREELDRIKAQLDVLTAPKAQPKEDPRPTRSQFATDEDYQEALTDWKVDQKLAEQRKAETEEQQKRLQAQIVENWHKRQESARADIEDYDAVVGASDVNLPQYLFDAIVDSDIGPAVAYHLAKNPAEARALIAMPPARALKAVARLEDRLSAPAGEGKPAAQGAKQPVVEKSNAPEPIEPLKATSSAVEKDPKHMSYQEWRAARQAGRIK